MNYVELVNAVTVNQAALNLAEDNYFATGSRYWAARIDQAEAALEAAESRLAAFLADNAADVTVENQENYLLGYSRHR